MHVNSYWKQLSAEEIAAGGHRDFVGGLWDEMGQLQADFLCSRGMQPGDHLLDMGCGALRGGLHYLRYLQPGRYCGVDINASLIQAGRREIELAGLQDRDASLAVSDDFDATGFGVRFDYAIAVSLFTHLPAAMIGRCLQQVAPVLRGGSGTGPGRGVFYATWFEAPADDHAAELVHQPGGVRTYRDSDPFHLSFAELSALATSAGLVAERIGDWGHPRAQMMAAFRRA